METSTSGRAPSNQAHHETEPAATFIEFWIWHDGELLPATEAELEWIHEREREREARWRLRQWAQAHQRRRRAQTVVRTWLRGLLPRRLGPGHVE